ncbi:MAG: acetyl-CoA C-acyltransferase, partial [Acidobacteria bacterium]|nr:acetyl-CoA C-acyltransferase [Acidobacteriota bacterium]
MPARRVVILGAARTPIGRYGGAFKDVHPAELGAVAARAAMTRGAIEPGDVGELVFGHGRQAGSGPNPARQVGHRAGVPHEVPAQTINKACASGLQAIASGAQSILLGESDVVLVGGIESMSRMPYLVESADARWGHKMGHFQFVDAMYRDGFSCPLSNLIMGETAEVLARQYGITRAQSDAFALESQHKTEAAQKAGRFTDEIAPVALETTSGAASSGSSGKRGPIFLDEHPRHGSTIESLEKLPLAFPVVEGHEGIITAGSSSGITDGGAALVLASDQWAADRDLKPLATITGWASAGVDPRMMGIGPVPAIKRLEERSGLTID